jgi:hypothetical protein
MLKEPRRGVSTPLPTRNPGALITAVAGIHRVRIAVYVNFMPPCRYVPQHAKVKVIEPLQNHFSL